MSKFLEAIETYCGGMHVAPGPAPGCPECLECDDPDEPREDWYDLASEGYFSRRQCDSCGSTLGGGRYPAHGWDPDDRTDLIHLDICADCLMFHANGDEPDPEEWR